MGFLTTEISRSVNFCDRNRASSRTLWSCASLLAPCCSSVTVASTLLTDAAQCSAVLPYSSVAFTSASALMRSSTVASMARRAARMSGVVPSFIREFRFVARFRSKICSQGDVR